MASMRAALRPSLSAARRLIPAWGMAGSPMGFSSSAAHPIRAKLYFSQALVIQPEMPEPDGGTKQHEKVVMRVDVDELGLTPEQLERLTTVAGPRFNEETRTLTLVGRVHEEAAANKALVREQLALLIDDAVANCGGGSGIAAESEDMSAAPGVPTDSPPSAPGADNGNDMRSIDPDTRKP